ncbi:hypothetical protein J3458_020670 [Metarhizium acridum]|nr:hypothetical protein J3458_020670 [Metarhizium acridum]
MPLWEPEWLRVVLAEQQDCLQRCQNEISKTRATDSIMERALRLQLKHAQREVEMYRQAYEASKLDAQRLCHGKRFTSATGWAPLDWRDRPSIERKALERMQERMLDDLTQYRSFLQQGPETALKVRQDVEGVVTNRQHWTQNFYLQRRYYEEQMRDDVAGTQ